MPRLPFITFEGSEGCGKSTQVRLLAARLTNARVPLFLTREPGGTALGEKIRDLLQFDPGSVAMTPETELLLFEASRSQLVREIIQPALDRGMVVISDRFADSTTVYQGVARRLDQEMVGHLNTFAVGSCWPDLTFLLDVDVATARARMLAAGAPGGRIDRMEQEPSILRSGLRGLSRIGRARALSHSDDRWHATDRRNRTGNLGNDCDAL